MVEDQSSVYTNQGRFALHFGGRVDGEIEATIADDAPNEPRCFRQRSAELCESFVGRRRQCARLAEGKTRQIRVAVGQQPCLQRSQGHRGLRRYDLVVAQDQFYDVNRDCVRAWGARSQRKLSRDVCHGPPRPDCRGACLLRWAGATAFSWIRRSLSRWSTCGMGRRMNEMPAMGT